MIGEDETSPVRIMVETRKCVGHARCAAVAPEVFELDDNGYNITPVRIAPASLADQARRGARACPERIIRVENL